MDTRNETLLYTSQRTALAQSLRVSLQILELNNVELREFIDNSLNENPFLRESEEEDEYVYNYKILNQSNYDNAIGNITVPTSNRRNFSAQIAFLKFNDKEKEIANHLFDYISENKYINTDCLINLSKEKLISYSDILKIIKKLKFITPSGIFSFNLQDKLKNIFEGNGSYDTEHKIFIQHLDTFMSQGFSTFQEKFRFDQSVLHKIMSEIKNSGVLCNDPFGGYENFFGEYIYRFPDVVIEQKNVYINNVNLKIPVIDRELYDNINLSKKSLSENDKKYIKEKFTEAELLVKSINYRNCTLMKIVREIAYYQSDFFSENSPFMLPINAKSIASSIGYHLSTVHRAIKNKTVATPRGIFEIRDLMPNEMKSEKLKKTKTAVTDRSVKEYIRKLIAGEPKNDPYSDSDIVYLLEGKGINMSRRTVAKYRNDMDIANSNNRLKKYALMNI